MKLARKPPALLVPIFWCSSGWPGHASVTGPHTSHPHSFLAAGMGRGMDPEASGILTTHLFRYLQAVAYTCKDCRTALAAAQPEVWSQAARQARMYVVQAVRPASGAPLTPTSAETPFP